MTWCRHSCFARGRAPHLPVSQQEGKTVARPGLLPLLNWGFPMPPPRANRPAAAAALSAKRTPRWLHPAVLALAALALASMFSLAVGDADTWFHLRTGAYIVQNHKLPDPDPFSWTTYMGQPAYPGEEATRDLNIKHEWGAQVILYLVYAAGGFPGMVLFKACCLTFFSGMVGWMVWRRTGRFYLAVAAGLAAGRIARTAAADRPYLVTYVLMALTLWILERRRPLWVLPPLFVFWANAHGGYFMGWVLMGGYCGEALWQRLRGQPPKDEKTLWGATLLAILASGINPNYFNVIPGMFAYQHSALQRTLKEWHAPGLWPPSWYSGLLVGAAGVLLWAWRRVRPSDVLLFAVFAGLSLMAQRNVIFIGLIAPIAIASYLPEWKRPLPRLAEFAVPLVLLALAGQKIASGEGFEYWRGTVYMLGAALSDPSQTKWKLVYQDQTALVFMRQPPPGVEPLNPAEVFTSLDAQCTDHLLHEPGKPGCAAGLADLYRRLGKTDRSATWLAAIDQIRNGSFHAPSPQ